MWTSVSCLPLLRPLMALLPSWVVLHSPLSTDERTSRLFSLFPFIYQLFLVLLASFTWFRLRILFYSSPIHTTLTPLSWCQRPGHKRYLSSPPHLAPFTQHPASFVYTVKHPFIFSIAYVIITGHSITLNTRAPLQEPFTQNLGWRCQTQPAF